MCTLFLNKNKVYKSLIQTVVDTIYISMSGNNINKEQAGAELCQAQSSLQFNLASYKLSSLQLKSSKQHKDY